MLEPIEAFNTLHNDFGIQVSEIVLYCNIVGIYDIERFIHLVKVVEKTVRKNKSKGT